MPVVKKGPRHHPSLLGIPKKIQLKIIKKLDFTSKIALQRTNYHFANIISEDPPKTRAEKAEFIRGYELWAENNSRFGCYECLKLKAATKFADDQVTGMRAKGRAEGTQRLCVPCGLKKDIYNYIEPVIVCQKPHYACLDCGRLQAYGLRCMYCNSCNRCCVAVETPGRRNVQCTHCKRRGALTDLGQEPVECAC